MKSLVTLVLAFGLVMPSCTFLGKKDATIEVQFYEVDSMATVALEGAAGVMKELRQAEVALPRELREALRAATQSLYTIRWETRKWIEACSQEGGCPNEEWIRMGMESMVELTGLVAQLVMEVKAHGQG